MLIILAVWDLQQLFSVMILIIVIILCYTAQDKNTVANIYYSVYYGVDLKYLTGINNSNIQ